MVLRGPFPTLTISMTYLPSNSPQGSHKVPIPLANPCHVVELAGLVAVSDVFWRASRHPYFAELGLAR